MLKQKWNQNWVYEEGGGGALAALLMGGAQPKPVTLPHDAVIEIERDPNEPNGGGNGFFHEINCNYKKDFDITAEELAKNVIVEFEGVYQNAFVYVNNAFAGKNPYGYSNFYVDITKFLQVGKNQIKVIVKNGVASGRWYTGGGIYRDVNLMIAERLHFAPDAVQMKTVEVAEGQAVIRVRTQVLYNGIGVKDAQLCVELMDAEGNKVAESTVPVTATEGLDEVIQQMLYVDDAKLWDAENPYLYSYKATLMADGKVYDEEVGKFGIRTMQLDYKHGLRINGKVVKLRGGCIHHDNGVTGTAEFPFAAYTRVKNLKEAGFNAIRSSHYPMSRRLLEAADALGMYIMDEYSDVWTTTKVDFDYGMNADQWWEHDIECIVKKDYNHPSVIMYSIGNEIPETGNKFDSHFGKKLADKFRELDDSRYVTNALNLMLSVMDKMGDVMAELAQKFGIDMSGAVNEDGTTEINSLMANLGAVMGNAASTEVASKATEEAASHVDIVGYNYAAARYEHDITRFPNRILVGSETYPADLDVNWALVEKYPHVLGDFDWTAYDYLGETGIGKTTYPGEDQAFYSSYPWRSAYCGDINLIGVMRPVAYWRKLIWGLSDKPYLAVEDPAHFGQKQGGAGWSWSDAIHSWNWAGFEGKDITVEVYAAADEAELFVNGVSVGKKAVGEEKKYKVCFNTVYTPGELKVVTYKDGKEAGTDVIVTASDDVKLVPEVCCSMVPADGSDIRYIDLSLQDAAGNLNPGLVKNVCVSVEGAGKIQGFGSADPKAEENFFDMDADTFEGRVRAAVRGIGETGEIKVTFTAEGVEPLTVVMTAE